ncbi:MAG: acyl-CoA dehydrogenase, partial [Deltaproteobacteria bacterium]|nr:acyl-CoA dehydrogenase [Deltaproteobacteria bacterium]
MGMSGGGICLIDLNQPGVTKGKPLDKIGQRELPQGELYFDDAVCPEEMMFFDQESYEIMTGATLAHANALMGAIFTGVARSAYDLALQHSLERVQGGKLLSQHQLVQKRLFDMFRKVETARSLSRSVLNFHLTTAIPDKKYSIASKVTCTDIAFEVANDAVQLFGGYGLSKEYPIEKIFRDARAGLIEDGSNDALSLAAGNQIVLEAG